MNPRNMHSLRFFKIITRTSVEDGKLMIPYGFTKIHGDNVPNPLFLKLPDGKEWKINWNKHEGVILFQKGWKEFAKYYSLAHGHMVLFEFEEETCHFGVHIFNKSNLEIKYPLHGSQDEQHNLNQISEENSVEIPNQQLPCKKRRPKSPMSRPQLRKKLRTDTSDDVGRSSKLANLPKHVQIKEEISDEPPPLKKKTRPKSPMSCPQPPKKSKANNSGDVGSSSKLQNLHKHVQVNEEADGSTEALKKARNFRSTNPSFIFVMKPCYLYSNFLHVPSQFDKKYFKKGKSNVLLQVLDGRTWPSKYSLGRISSGWKDFVSDNSLKVGDVSVFELIESESLTLKVLIFPLGEEPQLPPPQETHINDREAKNSKKRKKDAHKECKIGVPQSGKATQRTSLGTNSQSFANEAGEEAYTFASENPFFTINITPKRWEDYRQYIPTSFKRKYLDKKEIVMLQFGKNLWPVKLTSPSKSTPTLSRGWTLFKEESKFEAGDVCVSELINREDAVLHVHIFIGGKATQRTSLGINFHSFTNEAEEEANKFTSQNPFFTINIKPNQWEDHRQYMPIAFKRKYLDKKEIVWLQFGKNLWPVKLVSQRCRSTAKLSKGWVVFTKVSKLQVGDACVFELINREDAVFDVHIFRGK